MTAFACGDDASPPVASTGAQFDAVTATPSPTPSAVAGAATAVAAATTASPPVATPTAAPTSTQTPEPAVKPTATAAVAQSPSSTPRPPATPAPPPDFTPLSPAELKARLEFAFGTETHVEGVATVSDADGTSTVTRSFAAEVIEIFENGHFLLTGSTFQEVGWIPIIFPAEEYFEYIESEHGGSAYLKSALGYCCERTADGLKLIIRGNQPVSAAMSTVSHEAGHARQAIANPPQSKATPGSHLDALQEAEAYAFEIALARKIGEYTGIRTSVFPEQSGLRSYIDNWREDVRESLTDQNKIHKRAQLILWLAVLHDPDLVDLKTQLLEAGSLSADSMLALHNRLLRLVPSEAEAYVDSLVGSLGELSGDLNFILGTIDGRIGHPVEFPELVLTLSP